MKKIAKKTANIKTKYGTFRCAFEPGYDMSGYVVTVPSVKGAISWGKTLADAKRYAVEAIEVAIEGEMVIEAHRAGYVSLRRSPKVLA